MFSPASGEREGRTVPEQEWQLQLHRSEQGEGKMEVEWAVETSMNGAELRTQDSWELPACHPLMYISGIK